MNCDFQFALRSVAFTPDQRPILDFGEDQMDIFLSEVGLIRGKATLTFEICSAHLDRLAQGTNMIVVECQVLPFLNSPKDLDLSYKTVLDFWDCI